MNIELKASWHAEKRVHAVLPVRVWLNAQPNPTSQLVVTQNISKSGARLLGLRDAEKDSILTLQRGTRRGMFRVAWIGRSGTPEENQIGIQTLTPDVDLWSFDWAKASEQYDEIDCVCKTPMRRAADAAVIAHVHLMQSELGPNAIEGKATEIHSHGCYVTTRAPYPIYSEVQMYLGNGIRNVAVQSVVRESHFSKGMRLEFKKVRRADACTFRSMLTSHEPLTV